MQSSFKLTTTVKPGRRIEFASPELIEGEKVELTIQRFEPETLKDAGNDQSIKPTFACAADYLASLPIRHHTPEEWAELERELQEDKVSWDR